MSKTAEKQVYKEALGKIVEETGKSSIPVARIGTIWHLAQQALSNNSQKE